MRLQNITLLNFYTQITPETTKNLYYNHHSISTNRACV